MVGDGDGDGGGLLTGEVLSGRFGTLREWGNG